MALIRAADHLVDQLTAQGCKHVFGVPGESYLPVLDALHQRDGIEFITCRQEGGAAMAADAYARQTGRPGVCMVTRGPGATNASAGVHIAYQDSVPLIVFIGQVARDMMEREAFQEIDYRAMFGPMTKWVAQIDDAARIQEFVTRAYRVAMSGRPGPVVLALPEDMLYDDIIAPTASARATPARFRPDEDTLNALRDRLAAAKKPMIMAGGGGWTPKAVAALERFAETQGLPVAVSFRSQGLMNNDHANYIGHFTVAPTEYLNAALLDSDLLLAIGPRLGEMTTQGYTLLTPPVPQVPLAHVFHAPEELGRVYTPEIALTSDMQSFCEAVADWPGLGDFAGRTRNLRGKFEAYSDPDTVPDDPLAGHFAHLGEVLPADAVFCNGAGNYATWLHRFYRFRSHGSQLAPTSGSMGFGVPAAVGAAVAGGREVFALAGDGCFMMTCQEMATAVHHKLDITIIIINNARYGTIRAHQEREYPGRVSGTELTNPDFAAMATAFGGVGVKADGLQAFKTALSDARSRGGLNLIELAQDRDYLAPGKRLG